MNAPDPAAFKAALRAQWDDCAAGWDAHGAQIREWLAEATRAMLDLAGVAEGGRVLDVAAGAGDQTLDIAARVGARGHVLATDLSPAIVALARRNAERAGMTQVRTRVADGERLALPPASFDAAVCRLGLMFFPDPLHGLREMHRALRRGGRACTLVFSRPEHNPCVGALMATALQHAGLPPRDPYLRGGLFSLGRPGHIDELFREAGFDEVATTAIDAPFRLPSVQAYLDFVRSSASPVVQILAALPQAQRDAAWAEMAQRLQRFGTAQGWVGPNELLLSVGRR
jgi:ubiquinone/menaquinone biosynthesis C-methylase UbiE